MVSLVSSQKGFSKASPAQSRDQFNLMNMNVVGPMSAPATPPRLVGPPQSMYPLQSYGQQSPMQPGTYHPSSNVIMPQFAGQPTQARTAVQPYHNYAPNQAAYPSPDRRRVNNHRSLVGFDPLLSGATKTVTPSKKASAPLLMSNFSSPPSTQAPRRSLTPQVKSTTEKKEHRRDVQSFNASDLRSISQDAMEKEGMLEKGKKEEVEQRSSSSGSREPSPTPPGINRQKPSGLGGGSKSPPRREKRESKKEALSGGGHQMIEKSNPSSQNAAKKRLPWSKKGHRRVKSFESRAEQPTSQLSEAAASTDIRSSVPNTPVDDRRSSMYPSIVKDLMELKFNGLQLPSLAKPSPTSFLTGKEDEVVRTRGQEPAPHQIEIPTLPEFVVTGRLIEFVENYRRVDQNFDLQQWVGFSRMDLRQVKIPEHVPIAQSLLECGDDVTLQGVTVKGTNADERLEAVVFEGQRQFIAVFRGTTEQQSKVVVKARKKSVPLDKDHEKIEVYQCFLEEYMKLEVKCFDLLDKLTEEHPFCDVVFTGHSFGAAMATLAAFRYANARPMMRASCLTLASPKVGFNLFRHMVNSLPNLKVMRLEFGQDGKCQLPSGAGYHVGHTLVLKGSVGHNSLKSNQPVLAYKFDAPKHKKFKTTYPDLRSYVTALEEVARLGLPWAKDFVGTSGQGVVVNNEARQVV